MANSVQDILRLIRDEEIQMVDFKMVDIHGQFRHVTIPAENFSEDMMTDGVGFDASNYGYAVVEKSDMVFIIECRERDRIWNNWYLERFRNDLRRSFGRMRRFRRGSW